MKKLLLLIAISFTKPCFCSETTVAKRKIRYEFFSVQMVAIRPIS